jgi:UDP-N-acetyl-2-amino-2-deoxyglucuronate dehydrogenase
MVHRMLLVGPGAISKRYLNVIKEIPEIRMVGVVGREQEKTRHYAEENQIPFYGTDLQTVVEASQADMVLICTPNAVHFDGVIKAAGLGLHVLCEKPLGISPEKQAEMIRFCRERGVKLAVGFLYRFAKPMMFIKDLIESGGLGRIMVMDVRMKCWRDSDYYRKSSWHGRAAIDGGGPFIQQGSHLIDLALWLGNGFKEVITACRFTVYHPIEVEDHGYGIVRFGNGAVGIVEASTVSKACNFNEIEINGTKGSVTVGFEDIIRWDVPGVAKPDFRPEPNLKDYLLMELLRDFAAAVNENKEPYINGESAQSAIELIDAIYAASGEPITAGS